MGGTINRIMFLIVDPFDDVGLFAHPGIWKNGVGSAEVAQISFERSNVNRGTTGNILAEIERGRDLLHGVEPCELPDAHTHRVTRLN